MLDLELEASQDERTVYVQDEPALEIALPQVFVQPPLTTLQRGKLPDVDTRAQRLATHAAAHPQAPLGADYQELVTEFQPLFTWVIACWDYLLSTEGCRFIPRHGEQKFGVRGDYRVVTDKDFSRLTHGVFRACVLEYGRPGAASTNGTTLAAPSLSQWLREQCWPRIAETYRKLENPPDPRQRALTAYSYLRCVPYRFLNDFHDELVSASVRRLPAMEWRAIDAYFLHFYTEAAAADTLGCSVEACRGSLRQGLVKLLLTNRLVYCLLRQIERY